ncbi:MAG: LysM peptidoglycan-binding domain-containing protein [Bacteroidales bacterium]|nr:LysM peptidoglycan-binding domain-containing protein [Bacteroidales bacterium]
MRSRIAILLLSLCCLALAPRMGAQAYTPAPVEHSTEKVRSGGKVYWSHVVKEKQTLFSIARAYGVTVDEICAANPDMKLKEEGPKTNAILLVPVSSSSSELPPAAESSEDPVGPSEDVSEGEYFIHIVRWFEDIDDISRKYGIPAETILSYNGLTSRKLKTRMKLRIPRNPEEVAAGQEQDGQIQAPQDTVAAVAADTVSSKTSRLEELLSIFKKKEQVRALLVMPFGANATPSENVMDFYCGFLLAARDLGREGVNLDLSVYDMADGSLPVTSEKVSSSDMVIGPMSPDHIRKVLSVDDGNVPVVSPLDPRASALVADNPCLVHAPSSSDAQYEEAVKWMSEDFVAGDKVLVINEKGGRNADVSALVDSLLAQRGMARESFSYSILEGRRVADDLLRMAAEGTSRVIITSDSEAFVHDVVRNLNLMKIRKKEVVLYGVSKIRSFSTIEVESLHKLNLHAVMSYHIDYDDSRVRDFIMAYRALYNAEPTQFSFSGYDIASFFVKSCHEGGPRWVERMTVVEPYRGLQADFLMSAVEDGGLVNTAVRRVVYTPQYRISLLR